MFDVHPFLIEAIFRPKFSRRRREIFETYLAAKKKAELTGDAEAHQRAVTRSAEQMQEWETCRLMLRALSYDITPPPQSDAESWLATSLGNVLTRKGVFALQKQIDDEKTRRFELKVRWLKLLTPIIAALAGLVGATTGLVLALKK